MSLNEIIEREKKKAKDFLRDSFEPHYLKKIEDALKSGGIDSASIEETDYTFVKVVFNILGTNETPLSRFGEEMKANLQFFIS